MESIEREPGGQLLKLGPDFLQKLSCEYVSLSMSFFIHNLSLPWLVGSEVGSMMGSEM
jgi:hypothetical protein